MTTLAEQIVTMLEEDREEARRFHEVWAKTEALPTARRIAEVIGSDWPDDDGPSQIESIPTLACVAFGHANGMISIVVRSSVTERRVDYAIRPDGLEVAILRQGVDGITKDDRCAADADAVFLEARRWVTCST